MRQVRIFEAVGEILRILDVIFLSVKDSSTEVWPNSYGDGSAGNCDAEDFLNDFIGLSYIEFLAIQVAEGFC